MQECCVGAYGAGISVDTEADLTASRLTIALAWIGARRGRDEAFKGTLFFNPAWDILLVLYIAHAEGRIECVKNVSLTSSAPATTVGRWISVLEQQGLIARTVDPKDKRRTLLSLLPEGLAKMELALDNSARSDAKLGLGRLRLVK